MADDQRFDEMMRRARRAVQIAREEQHALAEEVRALERFVAGLRAPPPRRMQAGG